MSIILLVNHHFYTSITGLVLNEDKSININGFTLYKTKHPNINFSPLNELNTKRQIGEITLEYFHKNPVIYHGVHDLQGVTVIDFMDGTQTFADRFCAFLWFAKDCSCNAEATAYVDGFQPICRIVRTLNTYTRADGLINQETFDFNDLSVAANYMGKYESIEYNVNLDREKVKAATNLYTPSVLNFVDYNKYNRIDKAIHFLFDARSTEHLPAKIAFIVLIIETLFTVYNDSVEISYKIGHRVAAYLETGMNERKEVFGSISKFYNIRSKYLHGQGTPKKKKKTVFNLHDFVYLAKELDEMCRKILKKVLDNPKPFLEENDDHFRVWLDSLYYQNDSESII